MQLFKMSSLDDTPSSDHWGVHNSTQPKAALECSTISSQRHQFVDIEYPCASKDDDHVLSYAKEVLSLGLLYKEFVDAIREGDGERIIRCWRYFLPLFKCADRKNYSIEAFNLLFEYEYALTERMKQQPSTCDAESLTAVTVAGRPSRPALPVS